MYAHMYICTYVYVAIYELSLFRQKRKKWFTCIVLAIGHVLRRATFYIELFWERYRDLLGEI